MDAELWLVAGDWTRLHKYEIFLLGSVNMNWRSNLRNTCTLLVHIESRKQSPNTCCMGAATVLHCHRSQLGVLLIMDSWYTLYELIWTCYPCCNWVDLSAVTIISHSPWPLPQFKHKFTSTWNSSCKIWLFRVITLLINISWKIEYFTWPTFNYSWLYIFFKLCNQ